MLLESLSGVWSFGLKETERQECRPTLFKALLLVLCRKILARTAPPLEFLPSSTSDTRFPSSPLIIRVPFFLAIRFKEGNPKRKRVKGYYSSFFNFWQVYPLFDPKYPLFGTVYPYLRVQGGSWLFHLLTGASDSGIKVCNSRPGVCYRGGPFTKGDSTPRNLTLYIHIYIYLLVYL